MSLEEGPNRRETAVCGTRFLPPGGTVSCWELDEPRSNAPGDSSIFGWGVGGSLKKGESSTGPMSVSNRHTNMSAYLSEKDKETWWERAKVREGITLKWPMSNQQRSVFPKSQVSSVEESSHLP